MDKNDLLTGKKVLIVDDEPDVLETLSELLDMCDITEASSFEEAKGLLETQSLENCFYRDLIQETEASTSSGILAWPKKTR